MASADPARDPAGARPGPLAGVRVLDLTRLLPGSYASSVLADLGAEVTKIEQPGLGDYMRWLPPLVGDESAYTWVVDRNKRSVSLDLKQPAGRDALLRLAATADVFFESFRPGVADRLGIGWEAVRAVNPAIVYCSLSGYGQEGPLRLEVGHDINYVGRAGMLSYAGSEEPVLPALQVADVASGSMFSVVGILAALHRARATGEGDLVEVSMTDGVFALQSVGLAELWANGTPPRPRAQMLNGAWPAYNLYECADGRWLTIGAVEAKFWEELCRLVGRPDLVGTQKDEAAIPLWRELFRAQPRAHWLALFEGRDVCAGPLNDLADAVADPLFAERGLVLRQEHPQLGPQPQLGNPIRLREHPATVRTPFPRLGEHTREALAAAGLAEGEIDALLAAGAAHQA